jgi:hypothetical protein
LGSSIITAATKEGVAGGGAVVWRSLSGGPSRPESISRSPGLQLEARKLAGAGRGVERRPNFGLLSKLCATWVARWIACSATRVMCETLLQRDRGGLNSWFGFCAASISTTSAPESSLAAADSVRATSALAFAAVARPQARWSGSAAGCAPAGEIGDLLRAQLSSWTFTRS